MRAAPQSALKACRTSRPTARTWSSRSGRRAPARRAGGRTAAPASARRSPAAPNQNRLALLAPTTNQPRSAAGCWAPMLPDQQHRVEVDVRIEQGEGGGLRQHRAAAQALAAAACLQSAGLARALQGAPAVHGQEDGARQRQRARQLRALPQRLAPCPARRRRSAARRPARRTAPRCPRARARRPWRSTKAFCAPMATIRPEARAARPWRKTGKAKRSSVMRRMLSVAGPMKANYLFFTRLSKTYAMLDYAALSALAAVVREGSFERAARALHVTPSAVSQRIRLLEERVGCALVVRDQPCRPPRPGRRLCQHVDRVRLLEQDLQGALPALAPQGLARVALPIAVNADSLATWFAPAIAAFAAERAGADGGGGGRPGPHHRVAAQRRRAGGRHRHGAAGHGLQQPARWARCATWRPPARPSWRAISRAASARAAWRRRPAWCSTPRTSCRRAGCGACATAMWNCRATRCPRPQAFVTAALAGMGWGLQPQALIAAHLADGSLVELVPRTRRSTCRCTGSMRGRRRLAG